MLLTGMGRDGVEGASRFLNRVWRFVINHIGGGETPPLCTLP